MEISTSILYTCMMTLLIFSIYWGIDSSFGFRMLYFFIFTIYTQELFNFFLSLNNFTSVINIFLSSNLYILSLTVLFIIVFVENRGGIKSKRILTLSSILFLIFTALILDVTFFSFLYSILLALFIVYAENRTVSWLYETPDIIKYGLAILFPVCLFFLNPSSASAVYTGLLLGSGIGYLLEQIKIRMIVPKYNIKMGVLATSIGMLGLILIYLINKIIFHDGLFSIVVQYFMLSLWGMLGAPFIFTKWGIYNYIKGHTFPTSSSV